MSKKACIYCGAEATTKDHIPPKSFFIKPAPNNLITVPSCLSCNNSFSNNEEYTRTILASALQDDGSTKLAEDIWHDKVAKSLLRNPKLLKQIYDGFRQVDAYYGPIYLGNKLAISLDRSRIDPVIKKVVRGMFYHKQGKPLEKDFKVKVLLNPDPKKLPKELVDHVLASDIEEIGNGVIRYRAVFVHLNPNYSTWAISFYNNDTATFVCFTGKDERPEHIT